MTEKMGPERFYTYFQVFFFVFFNATNVLTINTKFYEAISTGFENTACSNSAFAYITHNQKNVEIQTKF